MSFSQSVENLRCIYIYYNDRFSDTLSERLLLVLFGLDGFEAGKMHLLPNPLLRKHQKCSSHAASTQFSCLSSSSSFFLMKDSSIDECCNKVIDEFVVRKSNIGSPSNLVKLSFMLQTPALK